MTTDQQKSRTFSLIFPDEIYKKLQQRRAENIKSNVKDGGTRPTSLNRIILDMVKEAM